MGWASFHVPTSQEQSKGVGGENNIPISTTCPAHRWPWSTRPDILRLFRVLNSGLRRVGGPQIPGLRVAIGPKLAGVRTSKVNSNTGAVEGAVIHATVKINPLVCRKISAWEICAATDRIGIATNISLSLGRPTCGASAEIILGICIST